MTSTRLLRLGAAGLAVLALAGCASTYSQGTTPAHRIAENRALFESWPMDIQSAILDKAIQKGMTPEMVVMALGKPTRVSQSPLTPSEELWIYGTEEQDDQDMGPSGLTIGGAGVSLTTPVGGGGGGAPQSDDYREITFKDGKVVKLD